MLHVSQRVFYMLSLIMIYGGFEYFHVNILAGLRSLFLPYLFNILIGTIFEFLRSNNYKMFLS